MKKLKYILIIIGVFLIDQITKLLVVNNIGLNSSVRLIKNFFHLTHTRNDGAAFGIFSGNTILIILVSILVLIYLLFLLFRNKKKKLRIIDVALSLLIGGLLGNLADRLFLGYVRDFLDFKLLRLDFAIFNLGDVAIVIGAGLFLIGTILEERNENRNKRRI